MKSTLIYLALACSVSLPSISLASFSLSSINTIECTDAAVTTNIEVFFTTSDLHAQRYVRRQNTIPYDYGNKLSPYRDSQTGQLTLNNDPDAQGGIISLIDTWDINNLTTLILVPGKTTGTYEGTLTGQIETSAGWGELPAHELNCTVSYY